MVGLDEQNSSIQILSCLLRMKKESDYFWKQMMFSRTRSYQYFWMLLELRAMLYSWLVTSAQAKRQESQHLDMGIEGRL